MLSHWGSVWVSAISTKEGMADSDVSRSQVYWVRRVGSLPRFSPDGAINSDRETTLFVSWSVCCEGTQRYTINGSSPTNNVGTVGTNYTFSNTGVTPLTFTVRSIGYR